MQQFQSLQRLLTFYALSLLVMLTLYYVTLFNDVKENSERQSIDTFHSLQHDITHIAPLNSEIKKLLKTPEFEGTSYQLIFMMPSGQTYIHRHSRPNEPAFATVAFPTITSSPPNNSSHSAYTISNRNLIGTIKRQSGHQIYIILRHKPLEIDWISYRYWLPLLVAIILYIFALIYMISRRTNWDQLLRYTDDLSSHAKETYSPPPFLNEKSTSEFLYLGNTLSRISYQLHRDYRRIRTLAHRLERLVNQSPLPMLMIMRHGQISFFNQRFEQVFMASAQKEGNYELTDFVAGKDEPTQLLLQTVSNLRLTRTLTVYGLQNKQTYHLHITPWFGEHGQVHGFTVLLNSIHELAHQTEKLQQKNQKLKQKLDDLDKLRALVGYQLRVPLETMIDTLEPIDPATLTDEQNEILKSLIQTSQTMLTTLNNTLDIGNVDVRRTRLNIESVDIYKLGQEVNSSITNNTRQQGLELIYFFDPDCPRCIDTDDIRLRQILLNLLKNAIEFTTSGYVALTVDCITKAQITQITDNHVFPFNKNKVTEQSSHWVRFSIKDTGIGIALDKKSQLLTKFHQNNSQVNGQTNQNTAAAGIGLNNANSFAQLLGGFIELESTIGEGSTFTLYLPCRCPNYQAVYHHSQHLTRIHVIAIVNQPLVAEHFQRLCEHLSISTTIYTAADLMTKQPLTNESTHTGQTLAPILLLDYECYETITTVLPTHTRADNQDIGHQEISHQEIENLKIESIEVENIEIEGTEAENEKTHIVEDKAVTHRDRQQTLNALLANPSLPKILFSMKPERRIPSILLDKYDGFLTKPLDTTLLFSEILRLTSTARQKIIQPTPLKDDSSQVITPEDNTISATLSPLILVVEDSPTNQKIACKILSKLGYRSVVAEDGQKALELLKRERQDISLILMDCRMPVMDGLQATQAIRAQGDDIPIVALTANNTIEDHDACIQVGMDEFLTKPINKKELEAVLQRFIEP